MWTRAVDRKWIDAVCHELTRMTGWPTVFATTPPREAPDTPGANTVDTFSWKSDISDGDRTVGRLGVLVPAGRKRDDSFLQACGFADVVAQLLQRVLIEQSTAADLRTAAPTSNRPSRPDSSPDPWTRAVNRLLDVALRLTDMRVAAVLVADPENDGLRLQAVRTRDRQSARSFNPPLCEAPLELQALCRKPVLIRRSDPRLSSWLPDDMSLGVCYGIETSERPCGALWVFDRRDRRLTPRERQALKSVVTRLSNLIERAVLAEESALQRRFRSELRIASETQNAQLRNSDRLGGWCQVTSRLETYREVGGDLCEVIPLDDDRLLLAIGDAAGHSVPAAMIMATVRGALRVMVEDPDADEIVPERLVTRLNHVLHGVVESFQFMTLACAVIDRRRQTLRLANAGHPPLLLIREGAVQTLEQPGLLLGVVPDAVYHARLVNLKPNDVLVLYTDGVTEARGENQELFLPRGITEVARRHADQSADEIASRIWSALQTHLTPDNHDDRTLLVVRIGEQRASLSAPRQVAGAAS